MKINIVCTQTPSPSANGYSIDLYYTILALREHGFEIRTHIQVLDDDPLLLDELCQDDSPILFEGLRACKLLTHPRLKERMKVVRLHHIAHDHYCRLAMLNKFTMRGFNYFIESLRCKRMERSLNQAQAVCAISKGDMQYWESLLPDTKIIHLPCLFDASFPENPLPTEPFVLYHGNLDNDESRYVIRLIANDLAKRCPGILFVIAGRREDEEEKELPQNVKIIPNPTDDHLQLLLATAGIHLLPSIQPTGIKTKLLTALVKGTGHIIANHEMLYGHSLGRFCLRADTPEDMAAGIQKLITQSVDPKSLEKRKQILLKQKKAGISRLSLFK